MKGLSAILLHCENGHRWQELHDFSLVSISVDFTGVTLTRPWSQREFVTIRIRCPYCAAFAYYSRRHEPLTVQVRSVARKPRRPRIWK